VITTEKEKRQPNESIAHVCLPMILKLTTIPAAKHSFTQGEIERSGE
jgi:hypothetical protein